MACGSHKTVLNGSHFFHVFYGKILLQRNIGLSLTLRVLISFLSTLITKRTQEIKNQYHVLRLQNALVHSFEACFRYCWLLSTFCRVRLSSTDPEKLRNITIKSQGSRTKYPRTKPSRTKSPGQNPPGQNPPGQNPPGQNPRTKSPHYILYTASPCHPNSKHCLNESVLRSV